MKLNFRENLFSEEFGYSASFAITHPILEFIWNFWPSESSQLKMCTIQKDGELNFGEYIFYVKLGYGALFGV